MFWCKNSLSDDDAIYSSTNDLAATMRRLNSVSMYSVTLDDVGAKYEHQSTEIVYDQGYKKIQAFSQMLQMSGSKIICDTRGAE